MDTPPEFETTRPDQHPMFVSGPFDIIRSLPPVLEEGKTYGQFPHESTIAFYEPKTSAKPGAECNVIVNVSGYAVDVSTLTDDNVYCLHGRFVPRTDIPEDPTPVVFFDPEITLNIGTKAAYMHALGCKVNVKALGVVAERFTVEVPGPNKTKINNLHLVVQHTDYDNLRKDDASFEVMYIVPGDRVEGTTHELYQIGEELHVVGFIKGYNIPRNMWEVQVIDIYLTGPSENQLIAPTPQKEPIPASSNRRPGLKKIGSLQSPTAPESNSGIPTSNAMETELN